MPVPMRGLRDPLFMGVSCMEGRMIQCGKQSAPYGKWKNHMWEVYGKKNFHVWNLLIFYRKMAFLQEPYGTVSCLLWEKCGIFFFTRAVSLFSFSKRMFSFLILLAAFAMMFVTHSFRVNCSSHVYQYC